MSKQAHAGVAVMFGVFSLTNAFAVGLNVAGEQYGMALFSAVVMLGCVGAVLSHLRAIVNAS